MTKKILSSILLISLTLIACKKKETSWNSDWSAPLVHGHLTINDMIPVEYTETNSDGYLSLVIHEPIFSFSLDTLIKLPDTTIHQKTAIGLPTIEVSPGFELPDNYNQNYELGEIQLKRVILESGEAQTTIESPWPGKTKVTFTLPNVSGPDGPFERIYYLEAGSTEVPTEIAEIINMAYQDMDLSGIDGNSYNTLAIGILIASNEETESFTVTNTDSIAFSFTFKDLVPKYAKGYFGQYYFSDTMAINLPPLKKIVAGSVNLDSITLDLTIKNGFNLLAQSEISKITGYNTRTFNTVDLDFEEKNNTLNIDPATGGYYDYVPSEYPIELNNINSNIIDFIENLSDSIEVGYELKINPFGNISAGNDEFFPNSKMELFLDGEFPLNFSVNDLTIQDTITINGFDASTVNPEKAKIFLEYENAFPIGAVTKFYLVNDSGAIIDSIIGTAPIVAGTYSGEYYATTPYTGDIEFNFSKEQISNLETTKKLILTISFKSDGDDNITISPAAYFDFKIRTNIEISISY